MQNETKTLERTPESPSESLQLCFVEVFSNLNYVRKRVESGYKIAQHRDLHSNRGGARFHKPGFAAPTIIATGA